METIARRIRPIVHSLVRRKPLPEVVTSNSLCKCLTLSDLIGYGVGCSVGAGVYSLIGIGAAVAGPSISLSFLIAGIACIFTSLTYSEFAARMPITGSAYTFVYVSFGELAAWCVGWNLMLGYGISAAGVARSWASYAEKFASQILSIKNFPPSLVSFKLVDGVNCSPLAAMLVIGCSLILLAGVQESAKFNSIVTAANVAVLLLVIAVGATEMTDFSESWNTFAPSGVHGIMEGAGAVFFAYLGFDMVACLAEEVENPQETLPKGIVGSLLISMSIYVGLSLVVTGMVASPEVLGPNTPLINAFQFHQLPWVVSVITTGSMLGLTTATFTCLMGQPRIFYMMAQDGLLPPYFVKVNANGVLVGSTIATCVLVTSVAFFLDLDFLANVISCGTLQVFTFVNAGVLVLRLKEEDRDDNTTTNGVFNSVLMFTLTALLASLSISQNYNIVLSIILSSGCAVAFKKIQSFKAIEISTFACPGLPYVPCAGIICNIYMLVNLPLSAWIGVLVWLSVGMGIYAMYGMRHSVLNKTSESTFLLYRQH